MLPTNDSRNCVHVQKYIDAALGGQDWTTMPLAQVLFGLFNAFVFFVGLAANGGVLIMVAWQRQNYQVTARNILLVNLILADMLLCWTSILVTPFVAIEKNWNFGSTLCRLVPLCQSTSVLVISWSLTTITINRYVHIVDYTKAPLNVKNALLLVMIIWVLATAMNIPYILAYRLLDGDYYARGGGPVFCGQFCEEIKWPTKMHRQIYGCAILTFQFLLPTIIMAFCYGRILFIVHRDTITKNDCFSASLTEQQLARVTKRNRKLNFMLVLMVVAFLVPWLPLTGLNLAKDFGVDPVFIRQQLYFWSLATHSVAMTTVIWNPVFFFWVAQNQQRKPSQFTTTAGKLPSAPTLNIPASRHGSTISLRSLQPPAYRSKSQQASPLIIRQRAPSDTGPALMLTVDNGGSAMTLTVNHNSNAPFNC